MQLTGKQIAQIRDALVAAYSQDRLREMVRIELNQRLEAIAGGDNLGVVAFNLVVWAEQHGRIQELIAAAYQQNPNNPLMQQLLQDAQGWYRTKRQSTKHKSNIARWLLAVLAALLVFLLIAVAVPLVMFSVVSIVSWLQTTIIP